jgi:AcrR family transcriptional regulator
MVQNGLMKLDVPVGKPRSTYRHGDLRRALVMAGLELAQDLGPNAVTLREVTRRAGVVPNAAYRHFKNHAQLLGAVRAAALSALAAAMEKRLRALGPAREDADYARATLRAVGMGYLQFAVKKTGLFRTAFVTVFDVATEPSPDKAGPSGLNPFQLLSAALDRLAACGALAQAQRPDAEYLAWSAVHGLALLAIDGPVRHRRARQFDALAMRLLDMVEQGL